MYVAHIVAPSMRRHARDAKDRIKVDRINLIEGAGLMISRVHVCPDVIDWSTKGQQGNWIIVQYEISKMSKQRSSQ